MGLKVLRQWVGGVSAVALCSCAPTTSIDSTKYSISAESPRKLLVTYSMSSGALDPDTLKANMSAILESCGTETRFIFVENSYNDQTGRPFSEIMLRLFVGLGTDKTTAGQFAERIINEERAKIANFNENATLLVAEQSKSVAFIGYRPAEAYAWNYQASLVDRQTNAKAWSAEIKLGAGGRAATRSRTGPLLCPTV
jgi:hypothetical protein